MFVVGSLLWLNARKIVALFIDTSVVANSETVRLANHVSKPRQYFKSWTVCRSLAPGSHR